MTVIAYHMFLGYCVLGPARKRTAGVLRGLPADAQRISRKKTFLADTLLAWIVGMAWLLRLGQEGGCYSGVGGLHHVLLGPAVRVGTLVWRLADKSSFPSLDLSFPP